MCLSSRSDGSPLHRHSSAKHSVDVFTEMAAQDNARWPQAEPPGTSVSASGGSEVDVRQVRSSQYLNKLIEQDHRAVKRRCASMGGFKTFASAALAGIELAHRIRKRQFSFWRGRYRNFGSLKQIWDRALA